jgi:mRNA interferase MazF
MGWHGRGRVGGRNLYGPARVSQLVTPPVTVRRGEVWWVDLDPTRGGEIRKTRPAVVLTADALNRARRTVVVVPLSTGPTPRPPIVVAIASAGAGSIAVCDQVRAVDKIRLTRLVGQLATADLRIVEDGVRVVLGL